MKLYCYRGTGGVRNFGDELNHHVWPRLLPGIFDDDDDGTQFVGIGTLLNDRLPPAPRTVVFGAGVGYYGPPRRDPGWEVYCVRGPLSARALELPASAAVTDPGILVTRIVEDIPAPLGGRKYAFMPHWQTEPSDWLPICEEVGFGFIDPRWDPGRVLDAIRSTEILLTEAMHGAIVADALRVPWIPVRTRSSIRAFKWEDWCQSVEMRYRPVALPTIWPKLPSPGAIRGARRWARLKMIAMMLRHTAHRGRPVLSRSDVFEARLGELEDRLGQLRSRERWGARALLPPACQVPA